jgi:hypothetical protein
MEAEAEADGDQSKWEVLGSVAMDPRFLLSSIVKEQGSDMSHNYNE